MKAGRAGAAGESAVEVELTELDYLEAWRFSPMRKQTWRYWLSLPCLTCVAFLVGSVRAHDPAQASVMMRLVPSLLALALLSQEIPEVRSNWIDQTNRGLGLGRVTLRFDATQLELESAQVHYRVRWTDLSGRVETPRSLLIYLQRGRWLLIPQWPWSAQQLEALRAHVPGPPVLPRFDFVRFGIGALMVLLACWYVRNV